jgi:F-type H+-transporting ATPase subunit b
MDLLTPNLGLLFWQIVSFGTLFLLLRIFAWRPILSSLQEREDNIQSALDMAEKTRAEMTKLNADNQKLLADARAERETMLRGAKETADRLIAEAQQRAQAEGNKIMAQSRESMQTERTAMMAQAKKEVVALALDVAEKVLHRELADKSAQEQLVQELVANSRLN